MYITFENDLISFFWHTIDPLIDLILPVFVICFVFRLFRYLLVLRTAKS